MGQGQSRGAFAICGGGVAKLIFEAGQADVGDKRRGFLGFCGGSQIIFEHIGGQRRVAVGFGEQSRAVIERNGCVLIMRGCADDAVQRRIHVIEALAAGIEAGQGGPLPGGMRTRRYGLLELLFRGGVVLALFGNVSAEFMGARGVHLFQLGGGCLGFFNASAYYRRGLAIKITQIGQGFSISGIEADGLLELRADALGERKGAEEGGAGSLLAQGAPEPEMIIGVLAVKADRLLALGYGGIPLFECKAHAALQVVRLCLAGARGWKGVEQSKGLVRLTGLQCEVGLGQGLGQWRFGGLRGRCNAHDCRQQPCRQSTHRKGQPPHRTTLIGMPTCKGSPLVVPVAT